MTTLTPRTRRPEFIIIGAQKAGTTTLASLLNQVPGVALPREESPHFESPYFEHGGARRLEYELGSFAPKAALVGIKRPNYLPSPVVPYRVAEDLPECRAVCVLRNPTNRALSAMLHYMEYNIVRIMDPSEAILRLLEGEDLGSKRSFEILEWGFYSQSLERWEKALGSSFVSVLSQEDLILDPLETLKSLEFLRVPTNVSIVPRHANEGATTLTDLRSRSIMHRALSGHDAVTGQLLPRTRNVARLGIALSARRTSRSLASRPKSFTLSKEARHALDEFYAQEVSIVCSRYGISLEGK